MGLLRDARNIQAKDPAARSLLEVVLLYFYEGYPIREIASMLNLTEAAVSSRIRKAKQKLKAELEGGEDNEE